MFPWNRKRDQRLKREGCGAVSKECVLPCVGEERGRERIKLEGDKLCQVRKRELTIGISEPAVIGIHVKTLG